MALAGEVYRLAFTPGVVERFTKQLAGTARKKIS